MIKLNIILNCQFEGSYCKFQLFLVQMSLMRQLSCLGAHLNAFQKYFYF